MRYAVIDNTGKVVNVIALNGDEYQPPKDHSVILFEDADIGMDYVDGQFVDNRPLPEALPVQARITLDDIIAVLSPDQKAALQAKLGSK